MTFNHQLTRDDAERLLKMPSAKGRAVVAGKIAQDFKAGVLSVKEREIAIAIFRLLVDDAATKVRSALASHLKSCVDLPKEIVHTLARDLEEEVSVPVLEFSRLLDDDELLAVIAQSTSPSRLQAIARRAYVSQPISRALLEQEEPDVARTLFGNNGADIRESDMLKTIDAMAGETHVMDALLQRGGLPVACVEKIFLTVSDAMKQDLAKRHNLSRHLLGGKLHYAREWALLGVASEARSHSVAELVRHMHAQRRLTSSVVIRSLCVGDLRFFEHAMALWAGIPVENARALINDAGEKGFEALYRTSPLPPAYYPAVNAVLHLAQEELGKDKNPPEDFCARMVDKINTHGYDVSVEYMPLLLAIIKGNASDLTAVH